MRFSAVALAALVFAAIPAGAQSASLDAKQAPTGRYLADPGHTQVLFSILHTGTTYFYGRFDKVTGTLNFNSAQPENSAVSIKIDMTSLDTPSSKLNGELTGPGVFDAAKYPTATFTSAAITRTGPTTGKITGNLTIKNITKPVTLDVTFHGGAMNPMGLGYMLGFAATTTIKRSDFGVTGMPWEPLIGDDVKLIIEVPFLHQKD